MRKSALHVHITFFQIWVASSEVASILGCAVFVHFDYFLIDWGPPKDMS